MKLITPLEQFKGCMITEPMIDVDAAGLMAESCFPGKFSVSEVPWRPAAGNDLTGKTLLVMRQGGYGDLLWITRIIRKLKEIYQGLTVWIASDERHHLVFDRNDDVSRRIAYPIPFSDFQAADYHLTFESCIEPDRSGMSVYELYAERAGITLDKSEMIPIYNAGNLATKQAKRIFKDFEIQATDKTCMIHMGASTPWKSYPPDKVLSIAAALGEVGVKVILAGNKNVYPYKPFDVRNVYQTCYRERNGERVDFCNMETTLALMKRCDLFIGQDSGLIHFSAALNVPAIAIYGPFPAHAYVGSYPNVIAIEPAVACCDKYPCFPHLNNICTNQDRFGRSVCLQSINPNDVLALAGQILDVDTGTAWTVDERVKNG